MHLIDGDYAGRVGGADHVADIDQPGAGATVDGRADLGVVQLRARHVDRRPVGFDGGIELGHESAGGVGLLFAHCVGGDEPGQAIEIEASIFKLCLVLELVRLRLAQRRLIGARVDFHQHVAGRDILSLREVDLDDLAVDTRLHEHAVVGLYRAEAGEVDRHVVTLRRLGRNRYGRGGRPWHGSGRQEGN